MSRIHIFLFAVLLFVSPNIVTFIGYDYLMVQAFELALGLYLIIKRNRALKEEKVLKCFLLFLGLFSIYKITSDTGAGTRQSVVQIIGAPILLWACSFPDGDISLPKDRRICKALFKMFFSFYLIETLLAIFERMLGKNIFGWNPAGYVVFMPNVSDFRSASLVGHPLYNSLVVSIAMAFILTSPIKLKYKFCFWSLGFVAVLCFNTRAAIVINAILLGVYLVYVFFSHRTNFLGNRVKTLVYSVIIALTGLLFVLKFNLGGRLLKMGLMDDHSAQVRVDAWTILDYVDYDKLLFGYTDQELSYLMFHARLWATENFWMDQCLKFGLIFFVVYLLFYFFIIRNLLKGYFSFQKIFLLAAFITVASVNNSLSWNFFALFEFLFLIRLFNPNHVFEIIPKKYI